VKKTLEIHINNEFVEGPEIAVIEIDDKLQSRIQQLASAAKILDVYSVREFNGYPEFFMRDNDNEGETIIPRPPKDEDEAMTCLGECVTLNVTSSDFYWSGYVKHTDIGFETETVSLSDLGISPEPVPQMVEVLKRVEASLCTGSVNDPAVQEVMKADVRRALLKPDDLS